jgi:predicted amidohydrolase YtcJ
MVDGLDERPILVDSNDLPWTWCNSAALKEIEVADMPDPVGGKILRDTNGKPSGLIEESVADQIVLPFIVRVSSEFEKMATIRAAIATYPSVGNTGPVDLAMDKMIWKPLLALRNSKQALVECVRPCTGPLSLRKHSMKCLLKSTMSLD